VSPVAATVEGYLQARIKNHYAGVVGEYRKRKIAFWHRYGPGGHAECGGHAIPRLIEILAKNCEIHYFGMRSQSPTPPLIAAHAQLHLLPFCFNRSSMGGKLLKTFIWYLALPLMALRCRLMGVTVIYLDETLPLSAAIVRFFFGKNVAITVADFFMTVYFGRRPWGRILSRVVERLDFASWRRLPLIFTKVQYTRSYLAQLGIRPERVVPVYNPCDTTVYFPRDRAESRRRLGINSDDLVLVHHGILHPNKGNTRIIKALADLKPRLPQLRYLLVGAGPEEKALRRLVADLELAESVIFTGWLPTEADVNWALNAADIGLVMRIGQFSDSFHLTDTLVHEMACGLPILAARLAGIEEVIDEGVNGFLFDPNDMDEFKSKLLMLAGNQELRQKLGQAALETCRREFDLDSIAQKMAAPLLRLAGAA